jgi:parallel beta-helix repeat protein
MRTIRRCLGLAAVLLLSASTSFAKQGAVRALYTVPSTAFIEEPSGESVVTIDDTSGSIASVQSAIAGARSANPDKVIVIRLHRGTTYSVGSAGLVLDSHECLVAEGALIQAASASVTVPLITIASGGTNVSVSGGTLDGRGADIDGILAPAASRVNIDRVVVRNVGRDGISLTGQGNSTFDNEMTVTRCEASGAGGAGIHVQSATQTTLVDNDCHDNDTGIRLSAAWANVANNTCRGNTTGIDVEGGSDNVIANNTCNGNHTGIHAGGSGGMIVSNAMGGNSVAGLDATGTANTFIDNLFTAGNATSFKSDGTNDRIIAYRSPVSAPGQNYFYPPLVDNAHTDPTIVNGMGRTDLTIASTTIDAVQSQYNAARSAHPNDVIVLHLSGTFTLGANPLMLSSNTCVLLNGTIQIDASTGAGAAVAASATGQTRISISGGVIDGGGLTGNNGISISGASMVQVDNMTLQHFGPSTPRVGGSDVIHLSGGATPYVVTRCLVSGGAARGIWLQLSGQKSLISDNEVTDVNQDGVDCDSSTFGSVVKFNFCHDLVRYGVFIEQSASHNLALGNVCNNDARDINVFNNDANPRPATQLNSIVCNAAMGNNGIRNGGGSNPATVTSHNFFFNNTLLNASIQSGPLGTENYYSQTDLVGGTLSTGGVESFFNSAGVSGNVQVRDGRGGLGLVVAGASTSEGAAIVTASPSPLGNGTGSDEWRLVGTDSGFHRIVNKNSGLVMAVQGASLTKGAAVVQAIYTADATLNDEWQLQPAGNGLYTIVNRRSGLVLEVAGGSTTPGAALQQSTPSGTSSQQFRLVEDAPPASTGDFALAASPASRSVTVGGSTTYSVTVTGAGGFGGSVGLGASGLPAGATASFSPTSVAGSGSSTLTIAVGATTLPGTYKVTVNGASGSLSHAITVTLVVKTACVSAGTSFQTTAFAPRTGTFSATFDATPAASPINAVMALSQAAQTKYTGFATLARFNPSGDIDARNGGSFSGPTPPLAYSGGSSYHFRLVIDVAAHTYSVFVTPPGGTEQTVGQSLAFRSEQSAVTSLDHFGVIAGAGANTVCGFTVQ